VSPGLRGRPVVAVEALVSDAAELDRLEAHLYVRAIALTGGFGSRRVPDRGGGPLSGGEDLGSPLLVSRLDDWAIGALLAATRSTSSLAVELRPVPRAGVSRSWRRA
jgi:hypothetical protein